MRRAALLGEPSAAPSLSPSGAPGLLEPVAAKLVLCAALCLAVCAVCAVAAAVRLQHRTTRLRHHMLKHGVVPDADSAPEPMSLCQPADLMTPTAQGLTPLFPPPPASRRAAVDAPRRAATGMSAVRTPARREVDLGPSTPPVASVRSQ
eukprot:TRINITY_DN17307_c0_g1_i1.p2 TRINITY_DN17307_c0_g1~~TRINITY_DN17307_c0_g1_i1.p2  ORF type:complete len:149 (+),score=42.00 TRINITY_DN17307_c0_g1_i1:81-527(+)